MIKAVIFDLDDTLYRERAFVESGFMAVARHIRQRFGIDDRRFYDDLLRSLETQGRGRNFDDALRQYGLDDAGLVDELLAVYRGCRPSLTPHPDAIPVLKMLRRDGLRLGIITDGDAGVQRNKIACLGIEDCFDKILYTAELGEGYEKPHRLAYELMLWHFGIAAGEALYVGDNPRKDFIGARERGIGTIRILQGEHKDVVPDAGYGADFSIGSIGELPPLIAKLQGTA